MNGTHVESFKNPPESVCLQLVPLAETFIPEWFGCMQATLM